MSKVCTKCKIDKPLDSFYYQKKNNRHVAQCKPCIRTRENEIRKRKQDEVNPSITSKVCTKCKVDKSLEFFRNNYILQCKSCVKIRDDEYRKRDKVDPNVTSKVCTKCNIHKPLEFFSYRKDEKRYLTQCKPCIQIKMNTYRKNSASFKRKFNEYRKTKRLTDENYAIKDRLRARLRKMLRAKNVSKYEKTLDLLGCTFEEFKIHLESKFYDDMTWETKNFQLDHIIPISWFNLSNDRQRKYCFSYKNIQPLTFRDNSIKRDKIWVHYDISKNPYI